jgi:hypothetical protein
LFLPSFLPSFIPSLSFLSSPSRGFFCTPRCL